MLVRKDKEEIDNKLLDGAWWSFILIYFNLFIYLFIRVIPHLIN